MSDKRNAGLQALIARLNGGDVNTLTEGRVHYAEGRPNMTYPAVTVEAVENTPRNVFGGDELVDMQVNVSSHAPTDGAAGGPEGAEALGNAVFARLNNASLAIPGAFKGRVSVIDRGASPERFEDGYTLTSTYRLVGY